MSRIEKDDSQDQWSFGFGDCQGCVIRHQFLFEISIDLLTDAFQTFFLTQNR